MSLGHCLYLRGFRKCVNVRDSVETLQRDGDALEQEWSLTVVAADGCEGTAQLLKKCHAFDGNGSKRFEPQRDDRVRLLQINVVVLLPGGRVILLLLFIITIIIFCCCYYYSAR